MRNNPIVTEWSVISHKTGECSSKSDPCKKPMATVDKSISVITNADDTFMVFTYWTHVLKFIGYKNQFL